jgi:murein DD-endopeptidase MepM/ murein hydrolase activator NlpD
VIGWFAAALLFQAALRVPPSTPQGGIIEVHANSAGRLRFEDRTVPLFPDPGGGYLGLIPVPVALIPAPYKIELLDSARSVAAVASVTITDAQFPRQNIHATKEMEGLKPLPGEMEAIHNVEEALTPTRFWQQPFRTPTAGCMSSPFGVSRYHNGKFTGNYHRGVDIRAPEGQPVHAIAAGEVKIGKMYRLHGGTVGIDHGQGVVSMYIHLSRVSVTDGQHVNAGDVIGYVGHTGFATGPHLHWGLYVNGLPVNSNQWIHGVTSCGQVAAP